MDGEPATSASPRAAPRRHDAPDDAGARRPNRSLRWPPIGEDDHHRRRSSPRSGARRRTARGRAPARPGSGPPAAARTSPGCGAGRWPSRRRRAGREKSAERDERVAGPPLHGDEQPRGTPTAARGPGATATPRPSTRKRAATIAPTNAVNATAPGRSNRTDALRSAGRRAGRARTDASRPNSADREVHEEERPPAETRDEGAAEHRPDRGGQAHDRAEPAEQPAAPRRRHDLAQQRRRARRHQPAEERLRHPQRDEGREPGREGGEGRGDQERRRARRGRCAGGPARRRCARRAAGRAPSPPGSR